VAYDVAIELMGQGLVGSAAKQSAIEKGWQHLLPAASLWVSEDPGRVIAAVCNGLHNLANSPGARTVQWMDDMVKLAGLCGSVDEFLKCGQVAGWRAGLAHFRSGALRAADTLPESLAKAASGAPPSVAWTVVRERLGNDPWFNPEDAAEAGSDTGGRLRVVLRAGAFRGFGGLFPEPPTVTHVGENFLVSSGGGCWLLAADVFGATFHRVDPAECAKTEPQPVLPSDVTIEGTTVGSNGVSLDLPELGSFSSVAANSHTLALTSPLTHAVVLVALT
jgi:hypothetical protein